MIGIRAKYTLSDGEKRTITSVDGGGRGGQGYGCSRALAPGKAAEQHNKEEPTSGKDRPRSNSPMQARTRVHAYYLCVRAKKKKNYCAFTLRAMIVS